jgi:hypothetical protein
VTEQAEATSRSRHFLLTAAAVYAIHLLVVAYVFPPRVVFSTLPYGGGDYQTHYHQTLRVAEALRSTGHLWAYEPQFLCGHPAGLIFDVDNKAHFLFSYGLSRLGVPLATAFNLFSLLSALIAPLVLLLSARLLKLGQREQLAVLTLSIPTYFLDTTCRFFSTAGMISYVMAAQLSILTIALFWRLMQEPRARYFVPLLLLMPLAHLTHVWAFPLLAGPAVLFYARAFRRLPLAGHLQVMAVGAAVLAVNAYWLIPSFAHADLMTHSDKLGQARPQHFLLDLFEILPFRPPVTLQTTLFRYLALAAAIVVVIRWWRARDERTFPALVLLGWTFFLTYISAYIPLVRLTEPYRFVLALTMAGVVLCGPFVAEVCSREAWRGQFSFAGRVLVVLGVTLVLPQLGHQVLASAPELIPNRDAPTAPRHDPPPWEKEAMAPAEMEMTLRQKNIPPDYLAMADFLRRRCTDEGRILVEPWELGEFLGWATDLHIIGGFPDRRLVYEASNLFRDHPTADRYWGKDFADYVERYNVRYLLLHLPIFPMIESRRPLLSLIGRHGPYRVYRINHTASYFIRGSGRIRTELNRIALEDVHPDPTTGTVAIRFHYLRTLRCSPSCRIVKEPIADSDASFISIVGQPGLASTITLEHRP